jgi:hypothetical protein
MECFLNLLILKRSGCSFSFVDAVMVIVFGLKRLFLGY